MHIEKTTISITFYKNVYKLPKINKNKNKNKCKFKKF